MTYWIQLIATGVGITLVRMSLAYSHLGLLYPVENATMDEWPIRTWLMFAGACVLLLAFGVAAYNEKKQEPFKMNITAVASFLIFGAVCYTPLIT